MCFFFFLACHEAPGYRLMRHDSLLCDGHEGRLWFSQKISHDATKFIVIVLPRRLPPITRSYILLSFFFLSFFYGPTNNYKAFTMYDQSSGIPNAWEKKTIIEALFNKKIRIQ